MHVKSILEKNLQLECDLNISSLPIVAYVFFESSFNAG